MAPPSLSTLLAADIPDPTDFPDSATAPGLRQLDAALRCAICSELFEAPVTLACGHCFCSLCARNVIADKPECPTCRKPANEGQLRPNPATEEAITSWKLARQLVLRLAKEEEVRLTRPTPTPPPSPRKRKRERRASPPSEDDDGDIEMLAGPSRPPLRVNGSSSSSSSGSVPDSPRPRRIAPKPLSPRKPKSHGVLPSEMRRFATGERSKEGLVACPICGVQVQMDLINSHIDKGCRSVSSAPTSAPTEVRQKAEWSNIFGMGKERERATDAELAEPLPKVSYSTLKDKAIRNLLSEHKLSATGDRSACIARHKRWVMIWNANLDRTASLRRPVADLRSDLRRWEDEQARAKATSGTGVASGLVHEQKHDAEFKALIEKARPVKAKVLREATVEDAIVIPDSDS